MLVFGAIDFAAAVARIGKFLGYHVVVCDARPVFTTAKRFPGGRRGVVKWPHDYLDRGRPWTSGRRSACSPTTPSSTCPCWRWPCAPRPVTSAPWARAAPTTTGWPGSREAGLEEAELARLRSPIGLDLGARTPEETAVSIAAELIQLRWGGSGRPLTGGSGRIHGDGPAHDDGPGHYDDPVHGDGPDA